MQRISAAGGSDWQLRRLALLKAAYDRMQREPPRAQASASLHAERDRIVQQIAETARLLPAEAVPIEFRALLTEPEAASTPASSVQTAGAGGRHADPVPTEAPDLRIGLRVVVGNASVAAGTAGEFAIRSGTARADRA